MPSCLAKLKEIFHASLNLSFVTSCLVTLSIFSKIGVFFDRNFRLRGTLRKNTSNSSRFATFHVSKKRKKVAQHLWKPVEGTDSCRLFGRN